MKVIIHDGMSRVWQEIENASGYQQFTMIFREQLKTTDTHLWVWDGRHAKKIRQSIQPKYKAKRPPLSEDISAGVELFRELLGHTKAIQVRIDGYEGDDVIAQIVNGLPKELEIEIDTVDYDLKALEAVHPRLKCHAKRKKEVPAHLVRTYKAWVGDSSDEISGVPGFGDGKWDSCDQERLRVLTERIVMNKSIEGVRGELHEAGVVDRFCVWIKDNIDEFFANYVVLGFIPVEPTMIQQHTVVGVPDQNAGQAILNRYLLS